METFTCSACDSIKAEKGHFAPWEKGKCSEYVVICDECKTLMEKLDYKCVCNHSSMFFDAYQTEKAKNEQARKVLEGL